MENSINENKDFVTVHIGDQLFGIPVSVIHDVFTPETITAVPLAGARVGGVLNLRGRIVTAIDIRERLGLPARDRKARCMAVGIEKNGESYGIVIDEVGEVLSLDGDAFEENPTNMDKRWLDLSKGVYRLDGQLLVLLDVDVVLDFDTSQAA